MAPFVTSKTLPVIPEKMVERILRGDFTDMAELLKDNMEVERRHYLLEGECGQSGIGQMMSRREVPDIMNWSQCFSVYIALICSKYPLQKAQEFRCRGRGWLFYDLAFRQHISSLESTDFSKINQGLYTTTFLAYGGRGQFCQSCMLSGHNHKECALHPNHAIPVWMAGPECSYTGCV